jgi:opacity protein-like surface antigen
MKTGAAMLIAALFVPVAGHASEEARVGRFYTSFEVGMPQPEASAQFSNPHGRLALALGFGRRQSRYLAWEIDYLGYGQSFDVLPGLPSLPPLTASDGRASVETSSISGTLRLVYPLGAFEPYAGAGLGYYRAKLSVTGLQLLFFPTGLSRRESGIGTHLMVGADFHSGASSAWGLKYRKTFFDAAFGPEIPGEVPLGAGIWTLSFRRLF